MSNTITYTIYKTTCHLNGKIYIGQYRGNRKNYLGSGVAIKDAIKKYGRENFTKEILEERLDNIDCVNQREIYWIAFYNSTNPEIGYNLAEGGGGTVGVKLSEEAKTKIRAKATGRKASDKTKSRMSVSRIGFKQSEETKLKIKKSSTGSHGHLLGRKHSKTTLEKMKQSGYKRYAALIGIPVEQFLEERNRPKILKDNPRHVPGVFSHSEETLIRLSNIALNRERVACLHCNKEIDSANHGRWHGENCKLKYKTK